MSWTVHHERGVKAFHSGRPRVAVSCLEKALATIEQDPSAAATTSSASRAKSRALLHLARAYLVLSKPAEALKHAKALVKVGIRQKWNALLCSESCTLPHAALPGAMWCDAKRRTLNLPRHGVLLGPFAPSDLAKVESRP